MKRVMLVHSSGAEYGPYRVIPYEQIQLFEGASGVDMGAFTALGFTVREVAPEKITITKEQVMLAMDLVYGGSEDFWQALVDASSETASKGDEE